jgi:hypothetical protein
VLLLTTFLIVPGRRGKERKGKGMEIETTIQAREEAGVKVKTAVNLHHHSALSDSLVLASLRP